MINSGLNRPFQVVSVFAFLFSFSACHPFNHSEDKVVITVGSRHITKTELEKDVRNITDEMGISQEEQKNGIKSIINRVVEKHLIMEYGKDQGIKLSDDELDSSIAEIKKDYPDDAFQEMLVNNAVDYSSWRDNLYQRLLIEKITRKAIGAVKPVSIDEAQAYYDSHMQAYYDSHMNEFKHPPMVRLRQIVVKTGEEAKVILNLLAKGEDMGRLAEIHSITPEAKDGGIMGWIAKGGLEETLEAAVFALPIGKRSNILKSSYGHHIFEVMDIKKEGYWPLPDIKKDIEATLILQEKDSSYIRWINDLKVHYNVKIEEEVYTSFANEGKTT